jgi:hypothetical protein
MKDYDTIKEYEQKWIEQDATMKYGKTLVLFKTKEDPLFKALSESSFGPTGTKELGGGGLTLSLPISCIERIKKQHNEPLVEDAKFHITTNIVKEKIEEIKKSNYWIGVSIVLAFIGLVPWIIKLFA